MSAFIVSESTMHRVVNLISASSPAGREMGGIIVPSVNRTNDNAALRELGQALFILNTNAVNQRYNESEPLPIYRFKPLALRCRRQEIEWLKAVHCLLYQCSEGDVPYTRLYIELREFAGEAAGRIVRDLPEYREANWD